MRATICDRISTPLLIAVVATVVITGCATKENLSSGISLDEQTAIIIRNDSWNDVKVYLVPASGGKPVRIERVGSLATERIPVRGFVKTELIKGSLRFLLKPSGNSHESYTTNSVIVVPGDVLYLTVANQLTHSTLVVRRW